MPPMNDRDPNPERGNDPPKPSGAWWHILIWTAFGLTLVITVAIVVQAILKTTGFD